MRYYESAIELVSRYKPQIFVEVDDHYDFSENFCWIFHTYSSLSFSQQYDGPSTRISIA